MPGAGKDPGQKHRVFGRRPSSGAATQSAAGGEDGSHSTIVVGQNRSTIDFCQGATAYLSTTNKHPQHFVPGHAHTRRAPESCLSVLSLMWRERKRGKEARSFAGKSILLSYEPSEIRAALWVTRRINRTQGREVMRRTSGARASSMTGTVVKVVNANSNFLARLCLSGFIYTEPTKLHRWRRVK